MSEGKNTQLPLEKGLIDVKRLAQDCADLLEERETLLEVRRFYLLEREVLLRSRRELLIVLEQYRRAAGDTVKRANDIVNDRHPGYV